MRRFEQRRARAGDAGAGSQFPARIDAAATQNPAFVAVASKFTSAAGDGRAAEDGPGARLHQQHLLRRGRPEGGLIEESPIVAFLIALRADGGWGGFVIKIYVIIVYSIYILGIFTTLQECTKNTPQNAPPQG